MSQPVSREFLAGFNQHAVAAIASRWCPTASNQPRLSQGPLAEAGDRSRGGKFGGAALTLGFGAA
jgi:hypothetical protein